MSKTAKADVFQIDEESMECLFHWERALFGKDVSRSDTYIDKFWIESKHSFPHQPEKTHHKTVQKSDVAEQSIPSL